MTSHTRLNIDFYFFKQTSFTDVIKWRRDAQNGVISERKKNETKRTDGDRMLTEIN